MRVLCCMSFLLLAVTGCAVKNSVESYPSVSDTTRITEQPEQAAMVDTEAIKPPFTLGQCIHLALENNPKIAQRKWDIETSMAENDLARGQRWPFIGAGASYTRYLDDQRLVPATKLGELSSFTDEIISGDIALRVPLYTSGRLKSQVRASDSLVKSARHEFMRSRKVLVFNVSNVFYSILGQEEVVESLVFSQKALEEHRKQVQELLGAKKAAHVDLLRTEVRLADIKQKLLQASNTLNIQRSLLVSLMGLKHLQKPIEIQGELGTEKLTAEIDQSLVLASNQRRDYQAAKDRVAAQDNYLDAAKAGRGPTVSVEGAYGNRWAAGSAVGESSTSQDVGHIGLGAMIPIFDGGQISAQVRRERSKSLTQKEAIRELKLQIQLEVETAVSNMESTRSQVETMQKAVEQAKESLRIERQKYDLGKGRIVDVLDAQAALLEAQTSYYRAMADCSVAIAQWRLAVGEKI